MTGPEHYRAAEAAISSAHEFMMEGDAAAHDRCLAAAQVHATLALAAATAMGPELPADDWAAWYPVASEGPGAAKRRREAEAADAAAYEADRQADANELTEREYEAEYEAEQERRQAAHDEMINDKLAEDGRWG